MNLMRASFALFLVFSSTYTFAIWNGQEASRGQFPSTVMIDDCTATKVGPRHILTAAHCVYNNGLKPEYMSGQKLLVGFGLNNDSDFKQFERTIARTYTHPTYLNIHKEDMRADIALIVLSRNLPESIETAEIEEESISASSQVLLAGYGALGPNVMDGMGHSGITVAQGNNNSMSPLHYAYADTSELKKVIFKTPGPGIESTFGLAPLNPNIPLIGFGDSGGAVFDPGTHKIIGVNSACSNLAYYSLFMRVDRDSQYNIYKWITEKL